MGGEHARELITAEIAHWLGRLLTGTADEMGAWPAMAAATAIARQHGWAKGSLAEWGDALLTHVVFKVRRVGDYLGLCLGVGVHSLKLLWHIEVSASARLDESV